MKIISKITAKLNKEYHKITGRKKKEDAIRWGIIGLGAMAEVFANALEASRESTVAAVASRSMDKANAFAKRHHTGRAYASYEDMLMAEKNELDVIYIATPQKYHFEHIKMCLENGYHVLCEKPITSNADQLKELMALAKEKDVFLMEGMWSYCLPTYKKAKEWIEEGKIGDVAELRAELLKAEQENVSLSKFNPSDGGGVLLDYGVYTLAFCTCFMKETLDVAGYERKNRGSGIDAEWSISLCDGNANAKIEISSMRNGNKEAVIIGTEGKILFAPQFNRTNRITLLNNKGDKIEEFQTSYVFDGFEHEIAEVNKAIRNKKKESECVPLEMSLRTLKIIDSLLKGKQ